MRASIGAPPTRPKISVSEPVGSYTDTSTGMPSSLMVMPFLSWAQRRTGRALGSGAVVADSTQTLLCTYLSAVLLVGLLLNATLGWSWADPIAGLVIAAVAAKEGREAWRGENCCGPSHADDGADHTGHDHQAVAGDACADGCCSPQPPVQLLSIQPINKEQS